MDVIYQATYEDFNLLESQVRELDAKKKTKYTNSIFRTLTGTRHKTRRQVTSIPPAPITLGAASPTFIPSVAANPGTSVTNTNPAKEASTAALNAPTVEEWKLLAAETALPATTASNESQLGASYLNNHAHHTSPSNKISVCSSVSFAQENLKIVLTERLNDKIYTTFKENFRNINPDSISEMLPKVHAYNQRNI